MHIIEEVKGMIWWVIKTALLIIIFVLAAVVAPIVEVVYPQVCLLLNPHANLDLTKTVFTLMTPLFVMFYMVLLCHWHSYRLWKRQGGVGNMADWRRAYGPARSDLKAVGLMFLGLLGSFVCEKLFMTVFPYYAAHSYYAPQSNGVAHISLWFAMFPLAAFAPVILLLLHRGKEANSNELERLEAELIAEGRVACDNKFLKNLGVSGIS